MSKEKPSLTSLRNLKNSTKAKPTITPDQDSMEEAIVENANDGNVRPDTQGKTETLAFEGQGIVQTAVRIPKSLEQKIDHIIYKAKMRGEKMKKNEIMAEGIKCYVNKLLKLTD